MKVERKLLKSISELSVFKYAMVAYLIFFILFVIIFAIAALLGWAFLTTSGLTIQDFMGGFFPGINVATLLGALGGGTIGIVLLIIIGLVASVFVGALAAFFTWILNVVLRIVGGIELRFALSKGVNVEKSPLEQKYEQDIIGSKSGNQ